MLVTDRSTAAFSPEIVILALLLGCSAGEELTPVIVTVTAGRELPQPDVRKMSAINGKTARNRRCDRFAAHFRWRSRAAKRPCFQLVTVSNFSSSIPLPLPGVQLGVTTRVTLGAEIS